MPRVTRKSTKVEESDAEKEPTLTEIGIVCIIMFSVAILSYVYSVHSEVKNIGMEVQLLKEMMMMEIKGSSEGSLKSPISASHELRQEIPVIFFTDSNFQKSIWSLLSADEVNPMKLVSMEYVEQLDEISNILCVDYYAVVRDVGQCRALHSKAKNLIVIAVRSISSCENHLQPIEIEYSGYWAENRWRPVSFELLVDSWTDYKVLECERNKEQMDKLKQVLHILQQ